LGLTSGSSTALASPTTTSGTDPVISTVWLTWGQAASSSESSNTTTSSATRPTAFTKPSFASSTASSAAADSSHKAVAIAAGVSAGVAGTLIALGVIAYACFWRRHRRNEDTTHQDLTARSLYDADKQAISSPSQAQQIWSIGTPSTLVEVGSPTSPTYLELKQLQSSPMIGPGPYELGARPFSRCELPGDLPAELPGRNSRSSAQELGRAESTKSKRIKTLNSNLPKLRSPRFSTLRPPAELDTTSLDRPIPRVTQSKTAHDSKGSG